MCSTYEVEGPDDVPPPDVWYSHAVVEARVERVSTAYWLWRDMRRRIAAARRAPAAPAQPESAYVVDGEVVTQTEAHRRSAEYMRGFADGAASAAPTPPTPTGGAQPEADEAQQPAPDEGAVADADGNPGAYPVHICNDGEVGLLDFGEGGH